MGNKLVVRNCSPQDAGDAAAYERLKEGAVFAHLLSKPDYRVDKNLFLAEASGEVVGFINVLPELGINRAVLDYAVGPSQDLQAVLPALVRPALKRAKQVGAGMAHTGIPWPETKPAAVVEDLGFKPVRRFCDMQLNISCIDLDGADRLDLEHRYFKSGDEALLSDIQNRCFAGAWGYNPNTVADTAWQLEVRKNRSDDVILALDKGEVTGYCWTESECGSEPPTRQPEGHIYMLGVDGRYRGKGLGRQLLRMGLWHLKKQGCELIDITVDTQNVAAITLYQSLGFQLCRETVWYEKSLG
ncbi:MAG: GNAT family N-acetyltransferase [Dehalococcoidia bacterium]|nr:GNAT family N-acetyltransferase [Dehalococcoidia bacterium]